MASRRSSKVLSGKRAATQNSQALPYVEEAASLANQSKKIQVWPEWSDADVNSEKWDAAHKGKEKEKGKSPVVQHFFDDPDGKLDLPSSLRVTHWKRPQEYIVDKMPTVVDIEEGLTQFDILTANEACSDSELVRYIISEISALWRMSETKGAPEPGSEAYNAGLTEETTRSWRPWDHIYAINKIGKGPTMPAWNPHGKYVVRLWWMGCWRKLLVDDLMPFNDDERPLLPMTTLGHELWPLLLSKALIKIASLDYNGGNNCCEFGDFTVIHCLTGWLPETIPLQYGHVDEIWGLLRKIVPQFQLPELPVEKPADLDPKPESVVPESGLGDDAVSEQPPKDGKDAKKPEKAEVKTAKGKEKGKDGKGDKKDKDKDKDKLAAKPDEVVVPEHPEMAVFASFTNVAKYPPRISALGEMADTSERLRQNNISHQYPHPVWIKQTRDCLLERPPPEEVIPPWKLIRPRLPKETPSDEPRAPPEPPKPIQCVEITSPFINYKVSSMPIPTDTHRPPSVLERGGTRPGTSNVASIMEADENGPSPLHTPRHPKQFIDPMDNEKPASAKSTATNKTSKSKKEVATAGADKSSKKDEMNPGQLAKTGKKESNALKVEDKKGRKERSDSAKTMKSEVKGKTESHATDGDIVPVTPQGDDGGFSEGGPALPAEDATEVAAVEECKKQMWMDFETFCKCFRTLVVYHKPATYLHKASHTDNMKGAVHQPNNPRADKKVQPVLYNDEAPRFLFVDSLKPTEVIVSFTSFSQWLDATHASQTAPSVIASNPSNVNVVKTGKDTREPKTPDKPPATAEPLPSEVGSVAGGEVMEKERAPITPGTLLAEPHSWKSLAIGKPVLRIRTTANRSAVLSLPAGRHVLKFNMSAPLGYYVNLVSTTEFTFGDEEDVMPKLKLESLRYKDTAVSIMQNLNKCMQSFHDVEAFTRAWDAFEQTHCPYRQEKQISKTHHYKVFMDAIYSTLRKNLPHDLLNIETAFALRAFFMDATTPNILGLSASSRPATGASTSHRGSAKDKKDKKGPAREVEKVSDKWVDHEPTAEEMLAQVKISRSWKGHFVRRLQMARTPGNNIHQKTCECLLKIGHAIESQSEQAGLNLLRLFFKAEPDLMPKYPFYTDEWNKISYSDYSGSYPDQPANSWFIVLREIFYVTEDTLCVPKMYLQSGLSTCLLRVVDNDTGAEIPRVFQKVAPHVYKRNRKGYTFVAEARTTDFPIVGNKWKMRLIGSMTQLPIPAPSRSEVQSSFHTREVKDYYVPQDNNVMLRYLVKVAEDHHLVSLQLNTSKPDVYIKLQVLDNEQEVLSAVGKGHVVLPSVIFQRDPASDSESEKRPSSRTSNKGQKGKGASRKPGSASQSPRAGSRTSLEGVEEDDVVGELKVDVKAHKYVIQAIVMRDSWPLNQPQWAFVQELKEKEREELKANYDEVLKGKEREQSPSGQLTKEQKTPQGTAKGGKGKGKDKADKGDKSKGAGGASRPASVSFDVGKPHWTLRVVSDAPAADDLDIRKDTERADEIRAMKRAWEEAEPGRAAKALQSRQKYLASHMIKISDEESQEQTKPATSPSGDFEEETVYSLQPPPGPKPKEILQPLDVTPFIRNMYGTPRYKDEAEERRQMEERHRQIHEYRTFRDRVEKWRDEDRAERNRIKIQQLEECERLQARLDEKRAEINAPREAFRQKYLEAERKRLEEIASAEAALRAEAEKSAPSPKGKKSGKKSPKASGKSGKKK